MTILLADSGATKTEWVYIEEGKPIYFRKPGLHPAYLPETMNIDRYVPQSRRLHPDRIFFYGAGCYPGEGRDRITALLQEAYEGADVVVTDDLTGAGRAAFGTGTGVICALGTGSIAGHVSHGKITRRSAALGFVMGDEGGAADLGKQILIRYFRGQFEKDTQQRVREYLKGAAYGDMMHRVYSSDTPARELGSIAGLVLNSDLNEELKTLVRERFDAFIDRQLRSIDPDPSLPVCFTGEVARCHQELLMQCASEAGFTDIRILESTIKALAAQVMEKS
ncbi:MAG: hypothetical protein ACNA78_11240 [Balneolaceae bacterium]